LIATEFLRVIDDYLQNDAGLTPVPKTVGIAEPVSATDLPAIVLEISDIRQLGNGLGERSQLITNGALPWIATIDLANPVLPEDPSFRLLSPNRLELVLPHGGLVRADGTGGILAQPDFSVTVAGIDRPVVATNPTGLQVRIEPQEGRLVFATALPAIGTVSAKYFLGQWEQRVSRISGVLRVVVLDANSATVSELSGAVIEALQPPRSDAIEGLHAMTLVRLGSIHAPNAALANSRDRVALFSFEYELKINRPDSSGGIIQGIRVEGNMAEFTIPA
jgi:hypothetical protein